jgi:hypothetical protein
VAQPDTDEGRARCGAGKQKGTGETSRDAREQT